MSSHLFQMIRTAILTSKQSDTIAKRVSRDYPHSISRQNLHGCLQSAIYSWRKQISDGHKALVDRVQKGSPLTYIGHGGQFRDMNVFLKWTILITGTNLNAMPAFLTATCEFTRVDDPGRTSAGELVFLNPNGGGICLFTTPTRFFPAQTIISVQRFLLTFTEIDGHAKYRGHLWANKNWRLHRSIRQKFHSDWRPCFAWFYPKLSVKQNTINGYDINSVVDTLKALRHITITGEIQNSSGSKVSSFNGIIYPTVFDKWVTYYTLEMTVT